MAFINPEKVIAQVGFKLGDTVADFGCGSGFYTIPTAKAVGPSGRVYAIDLLEAKVAATLSAARSFGFLNVKGVQANVEKLITGLPPLSCEGAILGNILHQVPKTEAMLKNVYAALKSEGIVVAVEWKNVITPFGPAPEHRVSEKALQDLMHKYHFKKLKDLEVDGYHYVMVFKK